MTDCGGRSWPPRILFIPSSVSGPRAALRCVAVGVRRLHDTGRSGWWTLIIFVPLIGALALIYFAVRDSEPGDNAYGPNPKTAFA